MLMQAHDDSLRHCPDIKELEDVCPLEVMLVSQIFKYILIVGKTEGAQHGLKWHCVLVPEDLQKSQTTLPRNCNDDQVVYKNNRFD